MTRIKDGEGNLMAVIVDDRLFIGGHVHTAWFNPIMAVFEGLKDQPRGDEFDFEVVIER